MLFFNKTKENTEEIVENSADIINNNNEENVTNFRTTYTIPNNNSIFTIETNFYNSYVGNSTSKIDGVRLSVKTMEQTPPLFNDVLAALYLSEDNIGKKIENISENMFQYNMYEWTYLTDIEKENPNVCFCKIYIRYPKGSSCYNEDGTLSNYIVMSPNLERLYSIPYVFGNDWYIYLNSIPHLPIDELKDAYKDNMPVIITDDLPKMVWNQPTDKPWLSK